MTTNDSVLASDVTAAAAAAIRRAIDLALPLKAAA